MNRSPVWNLIGVLLLVCNLPSLNAAPPKIVPFDDPDGTNTSPSAINAPGVIIGSYSDNVIGGTLGFIRTPGNKYTSINPLNAGSGFGQGTFPTAINPQGVVVGYYFDTTTNTNRGFLRAPTGTLTEFDSTSAVNGTFPFGINPAGEITGYYYDAAFNFHGFLASGGNFTEFNFPTSPSTPSLSVLATIPEGINPRGEIVGLYTTYDSVTNIFAAHFFLRDPNGNFTSFDPDFMPSYATPYNVSNLSINPAGDVTGWYQDAGGIYHGFVRNHNGTIIAGYNFDPLGTSAQYTQAYGINPGGLITGVYLIPASTGDGNYHGFLRAANGTFTYFDPPGSVFTTPVAINPAGEITGNFKGSDNVTHGFVRSP
jgi:hypothetical protein